MAADGMRLVRAASAGFVMGTAQKPLFEGDGSLTDCGKRLMKALRKDRLSKCSTCPAVFESVLYLLTI